MKNARCEWDHARLLENETRALRRIARRGTPISACALEWLDTAMRGGDPYLAHTNMNLYFEPLRRELPTYPGSSGSKRGSEKPGEWDRRAVTGSLND
jgi:hypothetical protein